MLWFNGSLFLLLIVALTLLGFALYRVVSWQINTAVLIIFSALSIGLYARFGSYSAVQNALLADAKQAVIEQAMAEFKNPQIIIQRLQARLQQQPNSAKGWYLLGRLYVSQGQLENANIAFSKANQLKPHDEVILNQLVSTRFFQNKRRLDAQSQAYLADILSLNPNNLDALNLRATDAYLRRDFATAIQQWEKMLPLLTNEPKGRQLVLDMIAKAQASQ